MVCKTNKSSLFAKLRDGLCPGSSVVIRDINAHYRLSRAKITAYPITVKSFTLKLGKPAAMPVKPLSSEIVFMPSIPVIDSRHLLHKLPCKKISYSVITFQDWLTFELLFY